jgi:hypothetical protein
LNVRARIDPRIARRRVAWLRTASSEPADHEAAGQSPNPQR